MANFTKLQMAHELISRFNITVSKGFLGLGSKAIYTPTGSPIEAQVIDYTAEMGRRLQEVIETPESQLKHKIAKTQAIQATQIGNMHAEVCLSRDRQFAAVQLFAFSELLFKPVCEIKTFTGESAALIASLF